MRGITKVIIAAVVFVLAIAPHALAGGAAEEDVQEPLVFWDMVWGPSETYNPASSSIAEQFTEETGIPVRVQHIGWDDWYQTYMSAVTSGAAPDIATTAFPLPIQFAEMGETMDLTPILEDWEAEDHPILEDIDQHIWDIYDYNGMQAAMPWDIQPSSIMYREDVFEELGLEPPETWEGFLDVARTIRDETDMYPFLAPAGDHISFHVMAAFLFQNETGFVTEDLEPNMTSPEAMRTMEFFRTLYEEELVPRGSAGHVSADAQRIYLAGDAAMMYGYILPGTAAEDHPEVYNNTSILPLQKGPDAENPRMMGWYNPIMVFEQTEYPEASMEFVKFYMDNYDVLYFEGLRDGFPSRRSWRDDPFYDDRPLLQEQIEQLVDQVVTPVWPVGEIYPAFPQIEGEIYPGLAVQEIFSGRTDLEQIGEEVDERIRSAIEATR